MRGPEVPPQCRECPIADLLKSKYEEASKQESIFMDAEAQAWVLGDIGMAKTASSGLAKVAEDRRLAEAGLNDLEECRGYNNYMCGQ